MKIVALADLHGYLPSAIPACDLLLLAGDLTPVQNHAPAFQAQWLDGPFRAWLQGQPARKIIGVAGNHGFVFEQMPFLVPRDLPWTYLQDSGTEWEGLKITFPRVHATCDYLKPIRFQDVVEVTVRVERIGRSSVQYAFEFFAGGEVIARGKITTVLCRVVEGRLEAFEVPEALRERLLAGPAA